MPPEPFQTSRKIHARHIDIATYESSDHRFVVEGTLKEDRLIPYTAVDGRRQSPHVVHHMMVRMEIDAGSLIITAINADILAAPHPECPKTAGALERINGLKIAPGFSGQVKRRLGGPKGCLHLSHLVLAMAPAVVQGYWVFETRHTADRVLSEEHLNHYLIDTCWVWRDGGPLATAHRSNPRKRR